MAGFYYHALSGNRPPCQWKKDEEGIWALAIDPGATRPPMPTPDDLHGQDPVEELPHSEKMSTVAEALDPPSSRPGIASSVLVEPEDAATRPAGDSFTNLQSVLPSRSATPMQTNLRDCISQIVAGVGQGFPPPRSVLLPTRLTETYEEYQARFVEMRAREASRELALLLPWLSHPHSYPFRRED